jgi:serine/threonine-protein kinase
MQGAFEIATDMGIGPGDLVAGRYRVVRVIGHGGMGVVVEAVHEALGQRVAIKFLRAQGGAHDEAATRFLLEAKALAQFKSVHIARVTDISSPHDEMPYFVMEYLDGHDLGAALEVDGVLGVTTAVDYAMQVCEALAEAYTAGIVHRDIKPANLFLTQGTDGTTLVKLLDFGISKHSSVGDTPELQMTRTSALMGSPRYMAPEQMRSMRRVDHRVDIWSLGVVLHESLTGQPPFVGETLPEVCAAIAADDPVRVRQLRRDVPIELQDIILRCLAKDPEKRYADVARLAQDLAPFASPDASVTARRISRIVKGPSVRPPPAPYEPLASTRPPSMALDDLPPARLAPLSVPPPRRRDGGKRLLPGWALLIVAVVAVPAFVVGALVSSPPLAPEAKPASSTNPSSVTTKPAASTAARPGTAAGSATGAVE